MKKSSIIFNSENGIVVNDGINGDASLKATQILNINSPHETGAAVKFGEVKLNSFVKNQTINVKNGILRFGSFARTILSVNGEELVVYETHASLENTDIKTERDGKIWINAQVDVTKASNFLLNTSMYFSYEDNASLSIDSTSNLTIQDWGYVTIDLGNIVGGEFYYAFMSFEDTVNLSEVLAALQNPSVMNVLVNGTKLETTEWSVSQGTNEMSNWIVVSGTAPVPEPSTYAVIFGALALGFAAYSRRK